MSKKIKDMLDAEEIFDIELPQDVVDALIEKNKEDLKEPEIKDIPIEIIGSEELSTQNYLNKHNSKVKKKRFRERALEKEIQLEGVSPVELANNPKLLRKYNRKFKKICQQRKHISNKKQREESKIIEKEFLDI